MFTFHELHVDDLAGLPRTRAGYRATCALVEALLAVAEGRGWRLALRLRHPLAEAASAFEGPDNALRRWEARGHELGAHAHGRHLARTQRALIRAGVRDLRGAVPGLAGLGAARRGRALAEARGLGLRYLTDQPRVGFAYAGRTPWRPSHDLRGPGQGPWVFIDPSADPRAWGLLLPDGGQAMGLTDAHFHRLEAQVRAALAAPRPHSVTHFGVTVHEHNHARALDDLRPLDPSLAAFDAHLGRLNALALRPALPRDIYAAWVALEGAPSPAPPHRAPDLSWLAAPLAPLIPARRALGRAHRDARAAIARVGQPTRWTALRVGRREVAALRVGPPDPERVVILSHAGHLGGTTLLLTPFGLTPRDLPRWAFYAWDRTGTGATRGRAGLAPGQDLHVEEVEALFGLAAAEGAPVGFLSFSAGLVAPLRAAPRLDAAFFIDGEGPADRWSLCPRGPGGLLREPLGASLAHLDPHDDAAWAALEPWRLVGGLRCPYHRLQAEHDHAHGASALHARVLLDAAPGRPTLNGRPWAGHLRLLPGRLQDRGDDLQAILIDLLAEPQATR